MEEELRNDFKVTITERYGVNGVVTDAIDRFQKKFECCGFDNFTDYILSAFNNETGTLPRSCCTKQARESKNTLCGSNKRGAITVYHRKVIGFVWF